ncbi:MAG: hypothetical protein Q4A59_03625 [Erysipelotrichaceae bacterium]|nr:hypothetical protein [Erysipelotrichaceae bacterium]
MTPCTTIEQAAKLIYSLYSQKRQEHPALKQQPFIISIDGRCASGKTTLAAKLAELIEHSSIVHLDDFFLQPHQRTEKRYQTPGRNVDDERLIQEVIQPYLNNQDISFRPFSCQKMALLEPIHLSKPDVLILEGCYINNELLNQYANIRIFTHVDPQTQQKRIALRNGQDRLPDFINKWIPLEEKYFETLDLHKFDLLLDLSPLAPKK